MKIMITGANGMLAKAVKERFKDETLICTDIDELDITKTNAVLEFVEDKKPDVIINCAEYAKVDNKEEDVEMACKVNTHGPENLAIACSKTGSFLVHISSDYVFGGKLDPNEAYSENDGKSPETVYGRTKLNGENAVKKYTTRYYIFRTSWLFGDGPNFVRDMLKLGNENEVVKAVYDQYGSPTYTVDLTDIICQALEKEIPMGVYNATNIGYTSLYDFTETIYSLAGVSCNVLPITSEEDLMSGKRQKNSKMSKGKLLREGIVIPRWEDALTRYLKEEIKSE